MRRERADPKRGQPLRSIDRRRLPRAPLPKSGHTAIHEPRWALASASCVPSDVHSLRKLLEWDYQAGFVQRRRCADP